MRNYMLSLRMLFQEVKQNNSSDNETQDNCANEKIYTYMRSAIPTIIRCDANEFHLACPHNDATNRRTLQSHEQVLALSKQVTICIYSWCEAQCGSSCTLTLENLNFREFCLRYNVFRIFQYLRRISFLILLIEIYKFLRNIFKHDVNQTQINLRMENVNISKLKMYKFLKHNLLLSLFDKFFQLNYFEKLYKKTCNSGMQNSNVIIHTIIDILK